MVKLYMAATGGLPDPRKYPAILAGLGEERKNKVLRMLQEKSRAQSLGAGLLLKEVLSRFGRTMAEVYTGANGKPMMDGLFFNLSHTEGRVLLAVSDREVGCDIERAKECPFQVAERFFCRREREYLSKVPKGEEQNRAFFRLWTIKESYMKMTGEGMSLSLDAFEVLVQGRLGIVRDGKVEGCYIRDYVLGEYQAAVCAREQITARSPELVCLI